MKNQWNVFKKAILEGRVLSLPSLGVKDDLDRDIWNDKDQLKPEIREKLLEIANDFWESQDLDSVEIKDIIFTGSLANYNWSKFSDVSQSRSWSRFQAFLIKLKYFLTISSSLLTSV